jgi:hypothetical protein
MRNTCKRLKRSYRNPRRHFKDGYRVAALQALTAARIKLGLPISTKLNQDLVALMCGSNRNALAAAITVMQCQDTTLVGKVLRGERGLQEAAKNLRSRARLINSYQNATPADRIALGQVASPGVIFDDVVVPAL